MRAAAGMALLVIACAPSTPAPLAKVLSTAPTGAVAPDAVAVEVALSAPLAAAGVEDGRRFALCRREDLRDVLRAIESDAGLATDAPVVPSRVERTDGGRRIILRPLDPLAPEQAWAAVLSSRVRAADGRPWVDQDGKARSVAVLFETGAAVDRSAPRPRWILPPQGPVPLNLRTVRIAFDEPVSGTISAPVPIELPPRWIAADTLEIDLLAPLAPGSLALDLAGITDFAGNRAESLPPLAVSACAVDAAPPLASEPRAQSGRLAVAVRGTIRGMGRLVAELTTSPGSVACGTVPAYPAVLVVAGDVAPCPRWDPCGTTEVVCDASVEVAGLCPGRELALRIAAEDLAGNGGPFTTAMSVAALPPAAEAVITEVLADADAPEAGGEYVEVANVGTGDLDLTGYSLAKRTATGKLVRCTMNAASTPVSPGSHAILVGGAYDGRYVLPAGAAVVRCGATALDGGLANDHPIAIELQDPAGTVVSTAGIEEPVERCAVGALERVHPGQPDAASNWTCPGTRSPGACNAATPAAECPRRPW